MNILPTVGMNKLARIDWWNIPRRILWNRKLLTKSRSRKGLETLYYLWSIFFFSDFADTKANNTHKETHRHVVSWFSTCLFIVVHFLSFSCFTSTLIKISKAWTHTYYKHIRWLIYFFRSSKIDKVELETKKDGIWVLWFNQRVRCIIENFQNFSEARLYYILWDLYYLNNCKVTLLFYPLYLSYSEARNCMYDRLSNINRI